MKSSSLLILLFIASCALAPKKTIVTKEEFKEVYFVTIEKTEENGLYDTSFLYRFEDCSKKESFPNLIRYKEKGKKAEQVYNCSMPDADGKLEMQNTAKTLCQNQVADINQNFCDVSLHLQIVPGVPLN